MTFRNVFCLCVTCLHHQSAVHLYILSLTQTGRALPNGQECPACLCRSRALRQASHTHTSTRACIAPCRSASALHLLTCSHGHAHATLKSKSSYTSYRCCWPEQLTTCTAPHAQTRNLTHARWTPPPPPDPSAGSAPPCLYPCDSCASGTKSLPSASAMPPSALCFARAATAAALPARWRCTRW
jgi:hypothetical protein